MAADGVQQRMLEWQANKQASPVAEATFPLLTCQQRILHATCPRIAPAAARLHQLGRAEIGGVARSLQPQSATQQACMDKESAAVPAAQAVPQQKQEWRQCSCKRACPACLPACHPAHLQIEQCLDDGAALYCAQAALHQASQLSAQHAQHAIHVSVGAVAGGPRGLGGQAGLCRQAGGQAARQRRWVWS